MDVEGSRKDAVRMHACSKINIWLHNRNAGYRKVINNFEPYRGTNCLTSSPGAFF